MYPIYQSASTNKHTVNSLVLLVIQLIILSTYVGACRQPSDKAHAPEGYVRFKDTPVYISPPEGLVLYGRQKIWVSDESAIQLQVMERKDSTEKIRPERNRPAGWKELSLWEMDTLINDHLCIYTSSTKVKSRAITILQSGPNRARSWGGVMRFTTKDKLYYLIAETRDLSEENLNMLQQVLLSMYISE